MKPKGDKVVEVEIPRYDYAQEWYGSSETEKLRSAARYAARYASGPALAPLNRILAEIAEREKREAEVAHIRRIAAEEAKKVCRRRWWA